MVYTRKHTRKAPVRRTRGGATGRTRRGKNPDGFPRGARLGKGAVSLNEAARRNAENAARPAGVLSTIAESNNEHNSTGPRAAAAAAPAAAAPAASLFGQENGRSWGDQELNANEADPSRGANARAQLAQIEAEGRARNAAYAPRPLAIVNGSADPQPQSRPALQQPQFNSSGRPVVNLNAARRQGQPNAVQLPAAGPLQLQAPINENAARAAAYEPRPLAIGNAPRNAQGNPILGSPNGWENHGPVARNIKPGVLPSGPTIPLPNAVRGANGKPVDPLNPSYPQSGQSPNYNLNSAFGKIKAEHNFVKSWANSMKTKINGLLAPPAAAAAGGSRRRSRKMRR
jgi:hypothetical protein